MKFIDTDDFSFPKTEEKVLEYWRGVRAFDLSLKKNEGKEPFRFYEGPPTANGRPGIHHVLARAFKDIICRYKTMRGYYVERKAGWDTHGLPVEIEVEKKLDLNTKKDIEDYGIDKFNRACKASVWEYKDEWEKLTERIAYWVDLDDPYVTYHAPYMETLWWVIKQFHENDLLYKGHKVVPWCTRCGSSLSSHELAQGYKTIEDRSVYMKFRLKEGQKIVDWEVPEHTYILSWTTTPWTLPGNVALAVGEDIEYVRLEEDGETWIYAKELHEKLHEKTEQFDGSLGASMRGADLVGLEYEPLFKVPELKHENAHKVYPADFVTTEDGTGVVHTAVMYGEDDYQLGREIGLPTVHTVDEAGKFVDSVPDVAGMYVRANKTAEAIFEHLKDKGYFLAEENYEHEYPHCWRCKTALLYYARESWFVAMSQLREKLLENNGNINWTPEHIKDGRFGEWLKDVKDWNFSRARYWGTPLPVWQCDSCDTQEVIGSRDELAAKMGEAKNRYIALRHGEALSNVERRAIINDDSYTLTERGERAAAEAATELKDRGIDRIIASPVKRTAQTAAIVGKALGIKVEHDNRLKETDVGIFEGKLAQEYHDHFDSYLEKFTKAPPEGENLQELRQRVLAVLEECEEKYEGETILIVSHEYPIWLLYGGAYGLSDEETVALRVGKREDDFVEYATPLDIPYRLLPRDETGQVDLHRPYIDEVTLACSCGGEMHRIEELADVWFDSGSMPFAQHHYPFGTYTVDGDDEKMSLEELAFPADYICEGVDQTRGWFYTLLSVATALGQGEPYRNAISLGHILDKNGEKMSKSKGNTVNPWEIIEKYGSDATRWYCYTVNSPGEPTKFDEDDLKTTLRRFFLTLYNTFVFYGTYTAGSPELVTDVPKHPLDAWMYARLQQTIASVTEYLDGYDVGRAARSIDELVDDLSKWYLRRSRRRLQKPESDEDYQAATNMLYTTLFRVAQMSAPFIPFFAEALYQALGGEQTTVHEEDWPEADGDAVDQMLLWQMEHVREWATAALNQRSEAGIKVRQPLTELLVPEMKSAFSPDLLDVLAEEVNVREVKHSSEAKDGPVLNTEMTPELKKEGLIRDLVRHTQRLRRDADYNPEDTIMVLVDAPKDIVSTVQELEELYKEEVGAKSVEYVWRDNAEAHSEVKLDGQQMKLGIWKV